MKKIKPKPKCAACGQVLKKFHQVKVHGILVRGKTPVVCMDCVKKYGKPLTKEELKEIEVVQ
jgi:hypothetical protein